MSQNLVKNLNFSLTVENDVAWCISAALPLTYIDFVVVYYHQL